jgi:hypothetical protein
MKIAIRLRHWVEGKQREISVAAGLPIVPSMNLRKLRLGTNRSLLDYLEPESAQFNRDVAYLWLLRHVIEHE